MLHAKEQHQFTYFKDNVKENWQAGLSMLLAPILVTSKDLVVGERRSKNDVCC